MSGESKSILWPALGAFALLIVLAVYLTSKPTHSAVVPSSTNRTFEPSSRSANEQLGVANTTTPERTPSTPPVPTKETAPAPDPNEVKWRKTLADLDHNQYTVPELAQLSIDMRNEISRLTLDKLTAMVKAGNAELVNIDSTKEYHVQQNDLTEITSITHMPGVGTLRAVLPRNGNELAYDLQDRVLTLEQELKQKAHGQ